MFRLLFMAFLFMSAGLLLLFHVPVRVFLDIFKPREKKGFASRAEAARARIAGTKKKGFAKLRADTKAALTFMGKAESYKTVPGMAAALALAGGVCGVFIGNYWAAPVLAVAGGMAPFYWTLLQYGRFQKTVIGELETALSIITTAYRRSGTTFTGSVEENLPYLNPPVRGVFAAFLSKTKSVTSDTRAAAEEMKDGINNSVFYEWVDSAVKTLDDANLKPTLPPIVAKLSDIRTVAAENELLMAPAMYEFWFMLCAEIAVVPLFALLNRDWYNILVHSEPGKALIAVAAGLTLVAMIRMLRQIGPLEYS